MKAIVLVPFYRGAVVFTPVIEYKAKGENSSRPLLSRSGCISTVAEDINNNLIAFSSPFIEERLYLENKVFLIKKIEKVLVPFYRGAVVFNATMVSPLQTQCSRPLLSRSGCIWNNSIIWLFQNLTVLVPFYRGAVVFLRSVALYMRDGIVLVPFYRGAVVFLLKF